MLHPEVDLRLQALEQIARRAGSVALGYFRDPTRYSIRFKGVQDPATEADQAVEKLITTGLLAAFPQDGILGEELIHERHDGASGFLWVIDPIDGTQNFMSRIPAWCVSIALMFEGRPIAGVVFDPNSDEMFLARRGGGATLNAKPIAVSQADSLDQGAVGLGYSFRTDIAPVLTFIERLSHARGLFQRSGSAALNLAYVAQGRLLGYWEAHVNAWDCLAGIILVEEAGGCVSPFLESASLEAGGPVAAAAPGVAEQLQAICDCPIGGRGASCRPD